MDKAVENEIRIATFLLGKNGGEFNNDLFIVCENYVKTHREFKEAVGELTESRKLRPTNSTVSDAVQEVFDRPFDSRLGKVVFVLTSCFILLSAISLIVKSLPKYNPTVMPKYYQMWLWVEGGVTIYFSLEIIVRIVSAKDKSKFFKRVTNLLDIVALVPFYVELSTKQDVGPLRVLRFFRVLQFLRNFPSVNDLFVAVARSAKVLVAPIIFLASCLIITSTVLYYAERGDYDEDTHLFTIPDCTCESSPQFILGSRECPRKESNFFSIVHTMWWGVVTLTTVGYGDLVPHCAFGKVVAGISMVLGVIFMAMPIAIVGSQFTWAVTARKEREKAAKFIRISEATAASKEDSEMQLMHRQHITPAISFVRFLRDRVNESYISLSNPSAYVMMLIDFYFGTKPFSVSSAPGAVAYELVYIPLDADAKTVAAQHKRISLNRYIDIVVGSQSHEFPDPDIVLPLEQLRKATGVEYRISQRHAVISVPPQFSDVPMIIHPLRGATLFVNGFHVPEAGAELHNGDTVNFHTLENPLLYQVKAVHPFALDV